MEIPGGAKATTATVIPGLQYADAATAIEWLRRAFGFEKHLHLKREAGREPACL